MQVAIVLYPGLTALDALGPYEVLNLMPDTEIRFVGARPGPVAADSGVLFLGVTHTYAETPAPDLVLVPGSSAATATAMADRALLDWLRAVHPTARWTTSVCSGALILAAAGLLRGKRATTHWLAQSGLAAFGAISCPSERIVRSGDIATAAGVSAGLDLALWLVGEIHGRERAETIQLLIEYDPRPPFDMGHPDKASPRVLRQARAELVRAGANARTAIAIPQVAWREALDRFRARGRRRAPSS
ncbi:DJ-1/PfpI family protein [Actinokineospora iranica]|uniref:DJ-1/PfpI family protein n=1 Tax=Actinokineospora iranica TaxID=1271860 RepID=A0A1G6U3Y2_9PSEU|nr:DJ-1/PfpI family protein [Actinokineospora iranica]SDD36013.1 DJ-1/PfpI family protein [Actinokineospora iranica]